MTIVLGGTALAVGPASCWVFCPRSLGFLSVHVDLTALTLGIMPLSFAYAITQGQMLGVRNFIRRGVRLCADGFRRACCAFALLGTA